MYFYVLFSYKKTTITDRVRSIMIIIIPFWDLCFLLFYIFL